MLCRFCGHERHHRCIMLDIQGRWSHTAPWKWAMMVYRFVQHGQYDVLLEFVNSMAQTHTKRTALIDSRDMCGASE
jgi:hypothetical protein